MTERKKMNIELTNNASESKVLNVVPSSTGLDISPRQRYRLSYLQRSPPPKTTLAAVLLLVGGLIMLSCGLGIYFDKDQKRDRGLSLIILGCISI